MQFPWGTVFRPQGTVQTRLIKGCSVSVRLWENWPPPQASTPTCTAQPPPLPGTPERTPRTTIWASGHSALPNQHKMPQDSARKSSEQQKAGDWEGNRKCSIKKKKSLNYSKVSATGAQIKSMCCLWQP